MGFIFGATIGGIIISMFIGVVLYFYFKDRSLKSDMKKIGASAEKKINADLKIWAKHTKSKFINASLYKYSTNKVFEVDSIIITEEALIVVEVKSINGGVIGNKNTLKWTKVLGEKRFEIKNPVTQNQKHIDHIITMLNRKVPVISLIVFSNKVNFLEVKDLPSHVIVTKHTQVFEVLDKIKQSLNVTIEQNTMKQLYWDIKSFQTKKSSDINLHKKITGEKRSGIWK